MQRCHHRCDRFLVASRLATQPACPRSRSNARPTAKELTFDTAEEQVVVITQPPAHSADTQHLGCFLATCRPDGVEQTLLQIGTAGHRRRVTGAGRQPQRWPVRAACAAAAPDVPEDAGTVRHVHEFGGHRGQLLNEFTSVRQIAHGRQRLTARGRIDRGITAKEIREGIPELPVPRSFVARPAMARFRREASMSSDLSSPTNSYGSSGRTASL